MINRKSLVKRHNPVLNHFNPDSPLSIGNGDFCFTADATGMQSFPELYDDSFPLCTQSNGGWHSFPSFQEDHDPALLKPDVRDFHGEQKKYDSKREGQEELFDKLRENPHRFNLGHIGLLMKDEAEKPLSSNRIHSISQILDLWTGVLTSTFTAGESENNQVTTESVCSPERDLLGFKIQSPLLSRKKLSVFLHFPYASPNLKASDWEKPEAHTTIRVPSRQDRVVLMRTLDKTAYFCTVHLPQGGSVLPKEEHYFEIHPPEGDRTEWSFSVEFSPQPVRPYSPDHQEIRTETRQWWETFWQKGGCVDLSGSRDKRAKELERRIVLSQYLLAIQSSGLLPPQETGLSCNSWYGKFHLEMHFWHSAHFPVWGRPELLRNSLWWYFSIADSARERARKQGYQGLRWPKMTGPEGRDSPSPIGPYLIWQQPHLLYMAEFLFRSSNDETLLKIFEPLVRGTADFMADYARYNPRTQTYDLGPGLIPAQENHNPEDTVNPVYELEYWYQGLHIAAQWLERMHGTIPAEWLKVKENLSKPWVSHGCYQAHARCPDTFETYNRDHPSMLAALGVLPGKQINPDIMNKTLDRVLADWNFQETWGWDFPVIAMTAARLGRQEDAINLLLMDSPKNTYLPNGHNPQRPRKDLPLYLPGNGALLLAVAMMTAGWEGCPRSLPGFPQDNGWDVQFEGIKPIL